MASFVGLYTGLSGVRAAQTGIDVTSHNVANANTPAYTRQRVELRASPSSPSAAGWIGTGVTVDSIARLRDGFLDDRSRSSLGELAATDTRAGFLHALEQLAGEPDEGLTIRIERLWDAAEVWANDPADAATRRQVLTELASIADGINAVASAWDKLGEDTAERRGTVADTATALLATIHELDRRIAGADSSRIGPDLLDQRDRLIDELAELTGATARLRPDGGVQLTLGGLELLAEAGPASFAVSADGSALVLTLSDGTEHDGAAVGGELGGLHHALTVDLPRWRDELDVLVVGLADAVNDVNTLPGGIALFTFTVDDPARTLQLATQDPQALVASTDGPAAAPNDATNARRLADLRTRPVGFGDPPRERTIGAQLADNIVGLAGDVRSTRSAAQAAASVATGAFLARAAEHGVSLDEEMVSLVRYQRALEAAARVMTTVDQALDVLVNRVGIVGR